MAKRRINPRPEAVTAVVTSIIRRAGYHLEDFDISEKRRNELGVQLASEVIQAVALCYEDDPGMDAGRLFQRVSEQLVRELTNLRGLK